MRPILQLVGQIGTSFRFAGSCVHRKPAPGLAWWETSGTRLYGDCSAWELRAPDGTIIRNMEVWWKAASECGVTARC